jgi:hypothetical protein
VRTEDMYSQRVRQWLCVAAHSSLRILATGSPTLVDCTSVLRLRVNEYNIPLLLTAVITHALPSQATCYQTEVSQTLRVEYCFSGYQKVLSAYTYTTNQRTRVNFFLCY